jgi:hypothetical protein
MVCWTVRLLDCWTVGLLGGEKKLLALSFQLLAKQEDAHSETRKKLSAATATGGPWPAKGVCWTIGPFGR